MQNAECNLTPKWKKWTLLLYTAPLRNMCILISGRLSCTPNARGRSMLPCMVWCWRKLPEVTVANFRWRKEQLGITLGAMDWDSCTQQLSENMFVCLFFNLKGLQPLLSRISGKHFLKSCRVKMFTHMTFRISVLSLLLTICLLFIHHALPLSTNRMPCIQWIIHKIQGLLWTDRGRRWQILVATSKV